ncbi:hypothetical protein ACTHQF_06130 [Pedobacter sp. SAFR-022]|uniref:hypothetical protein n=1 Tax=Pedobacter sp. SAFR-022 TaxID=3436861 RepID=UPI003F7DA407
MKNILLIVILLLFSSRISSAQEKIETYFVLSLNGQQVLTKNLMMSPTMVKDLEVVSRPDIPRYFSGKVDKVVLLKIIPAASVRLISLHQLYKMYKIDVKSQSLPIMLDGDIIKDATNFLIDESSLKSAPVIDSTFVITSDLKEQSRSKMSAK